MISNAENHKISKRDSHRRYHRRPRSREKDSSGGRYGHPRYSSATRGEDYEYDPGDYDDDEHYRETHRRDRRRFDGDKNIENMHRISRSSRDVYFQSEKDRYAKLDSFEPLARSRPGSRRDRDRERDREFNYDTYEDTPHPNVGSNKFNFEATDQGFESDFNTVPEKNLRFSNEFPGENDSTNRMATVDNRSQSIASGSEYTSTPPQHRLRFDDKITVSKFDLFEDDDFSKAEFAFENEDQWIGELPRKINLKNVNSNIKRPQDNIRKSDSVNIFAKKQDDPFADDDFFNKSSPDQNVNNGKKNGVHNNSSNNMQKNSQTLSSTNNNNFQWDNNFAKFDDNI